MGYFELANMLGSSLLGAVLTLWKQRIADDQERFKLALQGKRWFDHLLPASSESW